MDPCPSKLTLGLPCWPLDPALGLPPWQGSQALGGCGLPLALAFVFFHIGERLTMDKYETILQRSNTAGLSAAGE